MRGKSAAPGLMIHQLFSALAVIEGQVLKALMMPHISALSAVKRATTHDNAAAPLCYAVTPVGNAGAALPSAIASASDFLPVPDPLPTALPPDI